MYKFILLVEFCDLARGLSVVDDDADEVESGWKMKSNGQEKNEREWEKLYGADTWIVINYALGN